MEIFSDHYSGCSSCCYDVVVVICGLLSCPYKRLFVVDVYQVTVKLGSRPLNVFYVFSHDVSPRVKTGHGCEVVVSSVHSANHRTNNGNPGH